MDSGIGELLEKAERNIRVADHITHVTYRLFNDPKILLAAMDNIFLAVSSSITAILMLERERKQIFAFPDNFDVKLKILSEKCASNHKIDKELLDKAREIKETVLFRKQSPVEFVRKDKFVICDRDYRMKSLTITQVKAYLMSTKLLVMRAKEAIRG